MKKILEYAILILITAFSFLFSPKPENNNGPDKYCPTNYIHLNNSMGFSMNCDAIEFTGLSVKPGLLFQQNNSRQSRPLYILNGSAVGYSIYYLSSPFHKVINNIAPEQLKNQIQKEKVSLYLSHYAGLVFLNLFVLVIALLFYEKIILYSTVAWKNGIWVRIALLLMLISNNITKTFFWTPHQQMFNTLLPLFCIWLFISVLKNKYSTVSLCLLSFLCGILLLFYGSFLLLLPVLIISIYYKNKTILKQNNSQAFIQIFLSSTAFVLPIITWIIILKLAGVNFYSLETEFFRQFIWISDVLKSNDRNLITELTQNLLIYIKTSAPVIAALIFFIVFFYISHSKPVEEKTEEKKRLNFIFITVALIILIFFWLMGYYADRLTYSLSPVLICYAAIMVNRLRLSNVKKISIVCLILLWHIFLLAKEMPHFTDRFYY